MKIARTIFVFCACGLLLGSCATDYHADSIGGGFDDVEYSPGIFRIVFNGNRHTSQLRASDFAMLHAADVTLQHGCRYFTILNNSETASTRTGRTPGYAQSQLWANGMITTTYHGGDDYTIQTPHTVLLIQTFTNSVPGALDASFLQQSLSAQYGLFGAGTPPKPTATTVSEPAERSFDYQEYLRTNGNAQALEEFLKTNKVHN